MAKLTAKLSVIVTNDFCDTFTFRQHCHNKQATLYSVHRNFTVFLCGGRVKPCMVDTHVGRRQSRLTAARIRK